MCNHNKYFLNKIANILYRYVFDPADKIGAKRSAENFISYNENFSSVNGINHQLYWYNKFIANEIEFIIISIDETVEGKLNTEKANIELSFLFREFFNFNVRIESEEVIGFGGQ